MEGGTCVCVARLEEVSEVSCPVGVETCWRDFAFSRATGASLRGRFANGVENNSSICEVASGDEDTVASSLDNERDIDDDI